VRTTLAGTGVLLVLLGAGVLFIPAFDAPFLGQKMSIYQARDSCTTTFASPCPNLTLVVAGCLGLIVLGIVLVVAALVGS
jgi:hypothetical protein